MIPADLLTDLAAYRAAVAAAKPLAQASSLQVAALVRDGNALVARIDAALADTAPALESTPLGTHPYEILAAVNAAGMAARDAVALHDMRGLLGRAVLNLAQGVA